MDSGNVIKKVTQENIKGLVRYIANYIIIKNNLKNFKNNKDENFKEDFFNIRVVNFIQNLMSILVIVNFEKQSKVDYRVILLKVI